MLVNEHMNSQRLKTNNNFLNNVKKRENIFFNGKKLLKI